MAKKHNPEKEAKKLTNEVIEDLTPVVRAIIRIIYEADLPVGEVHAHDHAKFEYVKTEIVKVMLRENVKFSDKEFLFQLVLQPFDTMRDMVVRSLQKALDLSFAKIMGKEFRDWTVGDLDKVLKEKQEGN